MLNEFYINVEFLKLWVKLHKNFQRAVGGETSRDGKRRVGRAGADEAVVEERGDKVNTTANDDIISTILALIFV